jgi:hypothetical protein
VVGRRNSFLLLAQDLLSPNTAAFTHATEYTVTRVIQGEWRINFGNASLVHNHDAVVIDDSLQSMSCGGGRVSTGLGFSDYELTNTQQGLSFETVLHASLD